VHGFEFGSIGPASSSEVLARLLALDAQVGSRPPLPDARVGRLSHAHLPTNRGPLPEPRRTGGPVKVSNNFPPIQN